MYSMTKEEAFEHLKRAEEDLATFSWKSNLLKVGKGLQGTLDRFIKEMEAISKSLLLTSKWIIENYDAPSCHESGLPSGYRGKLYHIRPDLHAAMCILVRFGYDDNAKCVIEIAERIGYELHP